MTGHAPRANMTLAIEHLYKIGQSSAKSLSDEEACIVGSQQAPVFGRAFYNGVVYHLCSYSNANGKRDSTVCTNRNSAGKTSFARIEKFIDRDEPVAIVRI